MRTVKSDFCKRCGISKSFLSHIEHLSDLPGNVEICVILKSSFYLSLYNNVEATTYSILERFHEEIARVEYGELHPKIKEKIVAYYFGNSSLSLRQKVALTEKIISGDFKLPQLNDFMKVKTVFSGNLNLKIIREVFQSYGAAIKQVKGDPEHLLLVTTKRNQIAHGELSLSEAGIVTNKKLNNIMASVDSIILDVINVADEYLTQRRFLAPPTA